MTEALAMAVSERLRSNESAHSDARQQELASPRVLRFGGRKRYTVVSAGEA